MSVRCSCARLRVFRSAIVLRPSTLLNFHRTLRQRKYRWLFSPKRRRTGPKGPPKDLVDAIVDMKRRKPQVGLSADRTTDRARLCGRHRQGRGAPSARHARSTGTRSGGPSWLTFLGHANDSLWSIDLFRCESATLRSHWVLVVMDQYTRRIGGFGIHAGTVDGRALGRMFNHAIRGLSRPKRLSSDHDPLYRFHQWCANLRVLQVTEVKSVPYVPLSHPFVERLIGTLRRECVGSTAVLVCVGPGRQTGGLPGLLQCASGPCVVGRADARPDTKGCRTAPPLPLGRALPRTLSDADRGVNLNSEDGGERGDAPACRVCRVPAIAQQGSTSATHLTHAIARTSRMVPAPAT